MSMRLTSLFSEKQREFLADKLGELGNVAVGSLVFGFVLNSKAFSPLSLMLGLAIASATYVFAVILKK